MPVDPEGPDEPADDDVVLASAEAPNLAPVPLCDQAAVEREAEEWGRLWQEGQQYLGPEVPTDMEHLEALLPEAIRAAAATFPPGTGLGADHVAPRAVLRLSPAALVALAALFVAFEAQGTWCEVLDLVLIVLLPKPDGGFRPIGLSPR